jgi:hypothetical protein
MRISGLVVIGGLIGTLMGACGGDGGGTPTPSPTPSPTPGGSTITITSSGVSPKDITVTVGSRVTFTNNDNRSHDMFSDPHPEHTDCPEISVGFLAAGQSAPTQNLTRARVCGYHDHNQPSVTALQGTIRIQ